VRSDRSWNYAEAIAEGERRRQEWHDACATCGARYQGDGVDCPACHRKKLDAEELKEHRDQIRSELRRARDSMPPWEDWATFRKLADHPAIDKRIFEAALGWNRETGSLLLLGPTGIGKSACEHAIAHALLVAAMATPVGAEWDYDSARNVGARLRWYAASKLALARKQWKLGDGEADAIVDASDASILLLDELGYEPVIGDGAIFDVVNARYEKELPTIVTSGRTETELVDRYGAAFVRRLLEPGRVVSVHPKGAK
jgi:DNA replication protein DnaC